MTVERIKEEAIKQFSQKGYDFTSIKDITKVIGITAPALYSHYGSKEELFIDVFIEAVTELVRSVKEAIIRSEKEGIEKTLYNAYRAYVDEIVSLKPKSLLILRNTMFPQEDMRGKITEIMIEQNKVSADRIKSIFDQGIKDGLIIENSVDKYYRQFFKIVTSHIYEILAFKVILTREQIDDEWNEFWGMIKKEK